MTSSKHTQEDEGTQSGEDKHTHRSKENIQAGKGQTVQKLTEEDRKHKDRP